MRKLLVGIGVLMAQQAAAQCTVSTLGLDSTTQHTLLRGLTLDGTGMTAVLKPYLPGSLRSRTIIVTRADASGTPIWQKRITHTNPQFDLQPQGLANGPDGAVVVYGDITHGPWNFWGRSKHINQFAVKVDDLGAVEWARIYMIPDTAPPGNPLNNGSRSEQRNGMVILPDGTCAWALMNRHASHLIKLDTTGIPISAQQYKAGPDTLGHYPSRSFVAPDGSLYAFHHAVHYGCFGSGYYSDVFKIDPTGSAAWATRVERVLWMTELYAGTPSWVHNPPGASFTLAQNGDLLMTATDDLGGSDHMLRFSNTGQFVWESVPPSGYKSTRSLTELPSGDLLHISAQNKLIQSAPNGAGPVQVWSHAFKPEHIWSASGTLAIALGTPPAAPFAKLALAPDAASLSNACELGASTNGAHVLQAPTIHAMTVSVDTTIIKSWPMSLADSSGMALDVFAACTMGWLSPGWSTTILGSAVNNSGTASGPITVSCTLPIELIPLSYQPAPTSITGNMVTWTVPLGLPPDGYWNFSIVAQVPPDPLLLGTTMSTTVNVAQPDPETNTNNNTATYSRVVGGPYDPNNKMARTSSGLNDAVFFQGTDEWIDYTINFQNTGTAPAINVVLVDTLPSMLRVGSLLVMGATHPFRYELSASGVLRFIFDNINLTDSNANEPGSHGAVNFRIRPEPGLVPGTLVANRADIFFDFNPAVRTPDFEVWIDFITGVADHADQPLRLFPVPVKDMLTVALPAAVQPTSLLINSMDGRLVLQRDVRAAVGSLRIPVGDLKPQVYLLSVVSADGRRHTTRFVKE